MADIVGLDGKTVKAPPVQHEFLFAMHDEEKTEITVEGFLSVSALFFAVVDENDHVRFVTSPDNVKYVLKGAPVAEAA